MSTIFNAEEMFDIAIEIEENGHKFYATALTMIEDPNLTKEVAVLAAWEEGHIALMHKMKSELVEKNSTYGFYNPDSEAALYIKAIADSHIFIENSDSKELLLECESSLDILNIALQFEKDSVAYYSAIKEGVKDMQTTTAIDFILREELSHVAYIHRLIKEYS